MLKLIRVLLLCSLWNSVRSQSGGKMPDGSTYVCVPTGYCNNNLNPAPVIDPRIVTPGTSSLCPAGQIACFTYGPMSKCGVQFIKPASTADGPANEGAYPWQVYMQNTTNMYAGSGVLVDNYRVLTAAHKVAASVNTPNAYQVLLGVYTPKDLTTHVQKSTVKRIILHPSFNRTTLRNDFAILELATPFMLSNNYVNTACLPPTTDNFIGRKCMVAGWGQTAFTINDAPTNPMKQVNVTIVDYATCRASFMSQNVLGTNTDLYLDQAGEICAGGEAMKDACTQDGGSPLICTGTVSGKYLIVGLVIWGKNCGQPGVYGVYVNVPYYRNWIDTTIESLNAQAGR